MANVTVKTVGYDYSGRTKRVQRSGSSACEAYVQTWKTFTHVHVNSDGSGYLGVVRDGNILASYTFGPESEIPVEIYDGRGKN